MLKIIISGGGTGGHIFPAVSIADEIKKISPEASILFVGAEGKMEMQKVPEAGYEIIGLPISGFQRKEIKRNLSLPFKIMKSVMMSFQIIQKFKPHAVIGVGGYASGPILFAAQQKNIKTYIQEQNAYPGITNKYLGRKVVRIFAGYPGLEKFFKKEKIMLTGNPVRKYFAENLLLKDKAKEIMGLDKSKITILVTGGSLGARNINKAVNNSLETLSNMNIQLMWQCGKTFYDIAKKSIDRVKPDNIFLHEFIKDMHIAITASDIVISRAGAGAIAELSTIGKCCILIPLPTAAENHQYENALTLQRNDAALIVDDNEIEMKFIQTISSLINDHHKIESMEKNIKQFGKPYAAKQIAETILNDLVII